MDHSPERLQPAKLTPPRGLDPFDRHDNERAAMELLHRPLEIGGTMDASQEVRRLAEESGRTVEEQIEAMGHVGPEGELAAPETDEHAIAGDPGPEPGVPAPHETGPDPERKDTDELAADIAARIERAERDVNLEALVEQLAYRTLFLEGVVTVLVRELVNRGLTPREFEDAVTSDAEAIVEHLAEVRHVNKGRSGLVAAHLDTTRPA